MEKNDDQQEKQDMTQSNDQDIKNKETLKFQNIQQTQNVHVHQKIPPLKQRFESGMLQIENTEKIIIAMVGLPARGKSYFSKKVTKFLQWLGYSCRVFNIGEYRRRDFGTKCSANFFDQNNEQAFKQRQEAAQCAIDDLIQFLKNGGDVAIYDGTNTTKERRKFIGQELNKQLPGSFLMFNEIICDDDSIVKKNIRLTKLNGPDYKGMDPTVAENDFKNRIQKYQDIYEHLEEEENFPFIKLINMGKKYEVFNISGYLQSKILSFIFQYHVKPRPIYLARSGKVQKEQEILGGDWKLGEEGQIFGQNLNDFFQQEFKDTPKSERQKIKILTSTKMSAIETAKFIEIGVKHMPMKCLDELNFGIVDGFSLSEIEIKHPEIYKEHLKNNISYRYPQGESFLDLISRLEPVIFEIERSKHPIIVISHQFMLKALYCYFFHLRVEDIMSTEIQKHSLIKLIPDVNECIQDTFNLDSDLNYRQKSSSLQNQNQQFTEIVDKEMSPKQDIKSPINKKQIDNLKRQSQSEDFTNQQCVFQEAKESSDISFGDITKKVSIDDNVLSKLHEDSGDEEDEKVDNFRYLVNNSIKRTNSWYKNKKSSSKNNLFAESTSLQQIDEQVNEQ